VGLSIVFVVAVMGIILLFMALGCAIFFFIPNAGP